MRLRPWDRLSCELGACYLVCKLWRARRAVIRNKQDEGLCLTAAPENLHLAEGRGHLSCHIISFFFPPLINTLFSGGSPPGKWGLPPCGSESRPPPLPAVLTSSGDSSALFTPTGPRPGPGGPLDAVPPAVLGLDQAGPRNHAGGEGEARVPCVHPPPPRPLSHSLLPAVT